MFPVRCLARAPPCVHTVAAAEVVGMVLGAPTDGGAWALLWCSTGHRGFFFCVTSFFPTSACICSPFPARGTVDGLFLVKDTILSIFASGCCSVVTSPRNREAIFARTRVLGFRDRSIDPPLAPFSHSPSCACKRDLSSESPGFLVVTSHARRRLAGTRSTYSPTHERPVGTAAAACLHLCCPALPLPRC